MQEEIAQNRTDVGLFLDRIRKIAGARKLTPWLKSIGWIANDVTRIKAGVVPGSAKLQQLAEAEGVNLTWLLTGVGQPFVVEHYVTDASAMRRIKALGRTSPALRLLRLLGPENAWYLVVRGQSTSERNGLFAILVGDLGRLSLNATWSLAEDGCALDECKVAASEFIAVGEGCLGMHAMFDPHSGLFAAGEEVHPIEIREARHPFLTARDRLHASIEEMSETKAARWLALLNAAD